MSSLHEQIISQVEDFWSLYNHVSLASNLPPGSDYSFFKVVCSVQLGFTAYETLTQEGIFPDWEDEKNASGGRWIINSDRQVPGWSWFDFQQLGSNYFAKADGSNYVL